MGSSAELSKQYIGKLLQKYENYLTCADSFLQKISEIKHLLRENIQTFWPKLLFVLIEGLVSVVWWGR